MDIQHHQQLIVHLCFFKRTSSALISSEPIISVVERKINPLTCLYYFKPVTVVLGKANNGVLGK